MTENATTAQEPELSKDEIREKIRKLIRDKKRLEMQKESEDWCEAKLRNMAESGG